MNEDPEISAMMAINEALKDLSPDSVLRVIRWAADRFKVQASKTLGEPLLPPDASSEVLPTSTPQFSDAATLFDAAGPKTGAENALVLAYWLQKIIGRDEWTGFEINSELKHLGHGIGNITDALDSLISRKPALVIQTRKSGTSKQARKKYRLTQAGITEVQKMIAQSKKVEPET